MQKRRLAAFGLITIVLVFAMVKASEAQDWETRARELYQKTVPGWGNSAEPEALRMAQAFLDQFPLNEENAGRDDAETYYAAAYMTLVWHAFAAREYQRGYDLYQEYMQFFAASLMSRESRMMENRGIRCLLVLDPSPEEALERAVAAGNRFLHSSSAMEFVKNGQMVLRELDAEFALDIVKLYQHAGEAEAGWDFLRQVPIYHPTLIANPVFWKMMVAAYAENGEAARAAQATAAWFRVCRFQIRALANALNQVHQLLSPDQDGDHAAHFLEHLVTGEGPNPLAEVPTPPVSEDEREIMVLRSGGLLDTLVNVYLYSGQYDQALKAALERLEYGEDSPKAVLEDVARYFKARDLDLHRAHQFLRYVATGEQVELSNLPPELAEKLAALKTTQLAATLQESELTVAPAAAVVLSLLETGYLDEQTFPLRAEEQGWGQPVLLAALQYVELTWPDYGAFLPICAVLWEQSGEELEACLQFPPRARKAMAMYFGSVGADEQVRAMVSSISTEEWWQVHKLDAAWPHHAVWDIAEWLMKQDRLIRTAYWVFKRGAEIAHVDVSAQVCVNLWRCCLKLDDKQLIREDFIPWAEEALADSTSEWWGVALSDLIRAYHKLEEPERAVERGLYWLQQAEARGVATWQLHMPKHALAYSLTDVGQFTSAGEVLREIIRETPTIQAEVAQLTLRYLARDYPEADFGEVVVIPPRLERVSPEHLEVAVPAGKESTVELTVVGSVTLKVSNPQCDLPWVEAALGQPRPQYSEGRLEWHEHVQVKVGAAEAVGQHEGVLILDTNDVERPQVEVPLTIVVTEPEAEAPEE